MKNKKYPPEQYVFLITITDAPPTTEKEAVEKESPPNGLDGTLDADPAQPANESSHLQDADGG